MREGTRMDKIFHFQIKVFFFYFSEIFLVLQFVQFDAERFILGDYDLEKGETDGGEGREFLERCRRPAGRVYIQSLY